MSETIQGRLEKMKDAVRQMNESDKPATATYCTKCDEYSVGKREELACDSLNQESEADHTDHHVIWGYDQSCLSGYIQALEWVVEKSDS